MLASIASQLCDQLPVLPDSVGSLYKENMSRRSIAVLTEIIFKVLEAYDNMEG